MVLVLICFGICFMAMVCYAVFSVEAECKEGSKKEHIEWVEL